MLRTKHSNPNQGMPGWPIDGNSIKRQLRMIYWYSWSEHEFDIRVMRRVLGLPKDSRHDLWFNKKKPNSCVAFQEIMVQLQDAIDADGRKFIELLSEHDKLIEADAEAGVEQRKAWQEKAKKLPKKYKLGDLDALLKRVEAGEDLSDCDDPLLADFDDIPF